MTELVTAIATAFSAFILFFLLYAEAGRRSEQRLSEARPKVRCRDSRVDKDRGVISIDLKNSGLGPAKSIRWGVRPGQHEWEGPSELGADKEDQIESPIRPLRELAGQGPGTVSICLKYSDKYGLPYETVQPVKEVNLDPQTPRAMMRFEILDYEPLISDTPPSPGRFKHLWIGLFG